MVSMYRKLTDPYGLIHVIDPRHKKIAPCSTDLEAMCGVYDGCRGVRSHQFTRFEGPVSDATCVECRECCVKDGIS